METTHIIIAVAAIALGLLPAYIARRKGHNFYYWWAYGALLFPVAVPHALLLGAGGYKTCGFCRTKVRVSEAHCPHCGYEFIDL